MIGNNQVPGNSSHSGPPRYQTDYRHGNWPNRLPPLCMLVMGSQGCGKSSFINLAIAQHDCLTLANSKLCTRFFRFCKLPRWINGGEFRFTDTPGFGNETINDRKILELLVEYLAPNPRGDRQEGSNLPRVRKVTGLLYIHSEDEPFKSRTSQKTIEMLVKILGERFLDRVTILIRSSHNSQNDLTHYMPPEDSPLYPFYCNRIKPRTIAYEYDPRWVEPILWHYTVLDPRLVGLAALDNFDRPDGGNWQHDNIPQHLRELFPDEIGPPAIANISNVHTRLRELELELERLRNLLAQEKKDMESLRSTHEAQISSAEKARQEDIFNHEIGLKSLYNTIRDQEIEISKLKSSKDSELEKLRALKNEEIHNISVEIKDLRDQLHAKGEELVEFKTMKNKEISELISKKDLELEELRNEVRTKGEELKKLEEDSDRRVQEMVEQLRVKESRTAGLKTGINGVTKAQSSQERASEIDHLRTENNRISAEYASLRSHMQLEENTEQANITTALGDINRLIEEFGGSLTEDIEKYMEQNPSGRAFQPQDLLDLFVQGGNETDLKFKQDPYVLFEYAVQATICGQIYTHLFKPFHPFVADDEKQAQAVAGRWRKDAFNSISRDPSLGGQDKPDDERVHRLITVSLSTLLGKLIDIEPSDVLKEHDRPLLKIIAKAEELNRLVKGGVSILGDFQPIVFPFGVAFRPDYMSRVDSKAKKAKHAETVVATIGLGLVRSNASGGGRKPEETVLRKAVVFGLSN